MSTEPRRKYTLEEYFELERSSDAKFEYWKLETALQFLSQALSQSEKITHLVFQNHHVGAVKIEKADSFRCRVHLHHKCCFDSLSQNHYLNIILDQIH